MTQSIVARSAATVSAKAGQEIGDAIRSSLRNEQPDAIIVFASGRHDHRALLQSLADTVKTDVLMGSSSAGELTAEGCVEGGACALALKSSTMRFALAVGHDVGNDRAGAARSIASGFRKGGHAWPYRTGLIMTNALAGHVDDFLSELTLATTGTHQFFGGGAGDDARFEKTPVFYGTEVLQDAAVCLEILSEKPVGIGISQGWLPSSDPMRVTSAEGPRLISLNGRRALDVLGEHAKATKQQFDVNAPLPFFLHNVLGIETAEGYRLRAALGADADGALVCAAEVPEGATVRIMKTSLDAAIEAATLATKNALENMAGTTPGVALFFDCVATRLRLGGDFGGEVSAVSRAVQPATLFGCNTYGQIMRGARQFGGYHNCAAAVCVLPA
jgi:hypothetical protein